MELVRCCWPSRDCPLRVHRVRPVMSVCLWELDAAQMNEAPDYSDSANGPNAGCRNLPSHFQLSSVLWERKLWTGHDAGLRGQNYLFLMYCLLQSLLRSSLFLALCSMSLLSITVCFGVTEQLHAVITGSLCICVDLGRILEGCPKSAVGSWVVFILNHDGLWSHHAPWGHGVKWSWHDGLWVSSSMLIGVTGLNGLGMQSAVEHLHCFQFSRDVCMSWRVLCKVLSCALLLGSPVTWAWVNYR